MTPYLPFLIIIGTVFFVMGALKVFNIMVAHRRRRAPFTQKLERPPGQSLLQELDALSLEINIQAVTLIAMPLAIYAGYLSKVYFARETIQRDDAIIVAVLIGAFLIYAMIRILLLIKKRRQVRLGYEGELVVGQALNHLMLAGYRIYHDFPAEGFNIDHIVVGAKGVFAVETKTRSKQTTKDPQQDATVEYDGRALHFPKGTDITMLQQAERQARWLSGWLESAVGEAVAVRAVIALPGWLIRRTATEGMPVVNPKQFSSLFEHIQPRPLSDKMITRIAHQLEQQCKDITPASHEGD